MRINRDKFLHAFCLVIPALLISSSVVARPWLDPGDMKLRHELQLLSDAGMLNAPLTTWPLASKDIHEQLKKPKDNETILPSLKYALDNVSSRLVKEDYGAGFNLSVDVISKEVLIRDFSGKGREKTNVSYDAQWGSQYFDARLKVTAADKSSHPSDENIRLDESYIAGDLGNWKVTVGRQSRWWGPGWDGSLILSNNARPIPSISIENTLSKHDDSDHKLIRWLGSSKLHAFIGKLESSRGVPNAKLIGTRFTFKPNKSFEVGLHRTIQWGGDGQEESVSDFFKTLLSIRGDSQNGGLGSVRGNQLAGLDFRWNLPFGKNKNHYSLYGQYLGEDRVDGSIALGDEIFLLGGSVAGYSKKLKGSWRVYVEGTDTSAGRYKGRARNNIVYNHGGYTDGYRYQDISMGHGIDSDSQIIGVGAMLSQTSGNFWRAWVKQAKMNEDGIGNNPIAQNGRKWSSIGLSLDRNINDDTRVNFGVQYIKDDQYAGENNSDAVVSVGISKVF